jgi:hypothetical protein
MTWSILYKYRGMTGCRILSAFNLAIKRACELLSQGADVREVASGDGNRTIGADEIRHICTGGETKPTTEESKKG